MVKIGLEIHGYLSTNEKLFCKCKSKHGLKYSKPNTNICPVCTGQPGSKPLLPNSEAIKKIIQIALALNCKINQKLIWQRKHYSWPDLPKGYQSTISGSYAIPVGTKGNFEGINITEVHIEEDPASWNPETGEIDYNRSGLPLVEIVTEPEFKSKEQVVEWLRYLIHTLSYIKVLDKTLGIKADVNISVEKGKKIEIKNVNSISNIERAIENEIERQKKKIPQVQETRAFIEKTGKTSLMRTKENQADYRFISEPDLPTISIKSETIKELEKSIPETPKQKFNNLVKKHKISEKHAKVLSKKIELVEFFEEVIKNISAKLALPWITIELQRVLNYSKKELDEVEIKTEHFVELLKLVEEKKITELKAKEILNKFIPKSFSPKEEAKNNETISGNKEIEKIVLEVIENNKKAVGDYKEGKKEAINFLVGQVMRLSNKRADFKTSKKIIEKQLKK